VHHGVTTADIIIPGEVLATALGARVQFVGRDLGQVVGVEPSRPVMISDRYEDAAHPDVVLIPGGLGWRGQADDDRVTSWLRIACGFAAGVLCVSTGSLVLAAAGLLTDQDVAGHWLGEDHMAELGAHPVSDRVHISADGRVVTASGALAAASAAPMLAARVLNRRR